MRTDLMELMVKAKQFWEVLFTLLDKLYAEVKQKAKPRGFDFHTLLTCCRPSCFGSRVNILL